MPTIAVGQGIAKDSVVGDRNMNRYCVFNGLELPRRIDINLNYTQLGFDTPAFVTAVESVVAGDLVNGRYYGYVAVYASSRYTRLVSVGDGSGNYTRGNPSVATVVGMLGAGTSADVTVPSSTVGGVTHILIYRSTNKGTEAEAIVGPFFYVGQVANGVGNVTFNDGLSDAELGIQVEVDNFPPKAYRYAVDANSYVFAGGNLIVGTGYTCTATAGSSLITVDGGTGLFYDGMREWTFKILADNGGGVDEGGLYYANYVNETTLQLIDINGDPFNYNGANAGSGNEFVVYLPGNVLQWCKYAEPESWPTGNLINFEGDILGIGQVPNQRLLLVFTDTPSIIALDLNLIGTPAFKTNRHVVSTEFTTSSHYSIVPVEGRLRAICMQKRVIIETDGTSVRDISGRTIPKIFDYLSEDANNQALWHCVYDQTQHLFGAFVALKGGIRTCDFSIIQHTLTGSWCFNSEKDLLCSASYIDPDTGVQMALGGTEGPGSGLGGVWGRIWAPEIYNDWIPSTSVMSGTISNVVNQTTFDIDTSGGTMFDTGAKLIGRWVMVTDASGEFAQIGYILDNTASRIQVNGVIGGLDSTQFNPSIQVGWRFYLGLIEMRWGPKRWEFGDPEELKKMLEIWFSSEDHDDSDLPFVRLYRGYETGYDKQMTSSERTYWDETGNQSLVTSKLASKLEAVPRWGLAWYDRSYDATKLHSLTLVFRRLRGGM